MATSLKNRDIRALHATLTALTGTTADKEPKPLPWKVTYAMARTLANLRGHNDAIDKASNAAVGKHSAGKGGLTLDDPGFLAAQADVAAVLDMSADVDLHTVKVSDLETCGLSPKQLADLLPMVEG
ncbi:MAG TPA: hypothetical protein VHX44_03515 [Planctomycetota bacterium]|jgi:hypothetical protein|nr:hypothetical protein [Planctomycetota bacterium]